MIRRRIFFNLRQLPSTKDPKYQEKMQSLYEQYNSQFTEEFKEKSRKLHENLDKEQKDKINVILETVLQMNAYEQKVLRQRFKEKKGLGEWDWPIFTRKNKIHSGIEAKKGPLEELKIGGFPADFLEEILSGRLFEGLQVTEKDQKEEKEDKKEEKTQFDLVFKNYNQDQKVKVIKTIKDVLNLGLKEAKEKVEEVSNGPVTLFKNVSKDSHQELADKLKEQGAEVEFE